MPGATATTATAVSGMTLDTCKSACDVDATCNSFAFTSSTGACTYYALNINATTKATASTSIRSYWHTTDPSTIKGVNKMGFCTNSSQTNIASLTFSSPSGDVPPIVVYSNSLALADTSSTTSGTVSISTDGATLGPFTSVRGTTDTDTCSGRGTCIWEFGRCQCHTNWGSSDGKGGMGTLGDCGFRQDPILHAGAG